MSDRYAYYYQHSNGKLIHKPAFTVDSLGASNYFEGDFVVKWWRLDMTDRSQAWKMLIDAMLSGAKEVAVLELAMKWNCTNEDAMHFAKLMEIKLTDDGGVWIADFSDADGTFQGRGQSALRALAALAKAGLVMMKAQKGKFS